MKCLTKRSSFLRWLEKEKRTVQFCKIFFLWKDSDPGKAEVNWMMAVSDLPASEL